jgi:23S rRNA pseudouridine2605 synthase
MKTQKNQEELVRLNKFISHNSKYSRREADKLIEEGRVSLNNTIVTNMATKVNNDDMIEIDNKKVFHNPNKQFTVIVYNKQKGELVTKNDPRGRKTIFDSISKQFNHYTPIGRLDYNSEGVLLLTDSVEIVNKLMHSSLERTYKLKVNGLITDDIIHSMENGMELTDATKGAHSHTQITSMKFEPFLGYQIQTNNSNFSKLKVKIAEGKNRELRRFFGYFDLDIVDLKRLDFGGISLNSLPSGKHRFLNKEEYRNLKDFIYSSKDNY